MKIKLLFLISMLNLYIQACGSREFNSSPVSSVELIDENRIFTEIKRLDARKQELVKKLSPEDIENCQNYSVESLAAGDSKAALQANAIKRDYCLVGLYIKDTQEQKDLWKSIKDYRNVIASLESKSDPLYEIHETLFQHHNALSDEYDDMMDYYLDTFEGEWAIYQDPQAKKNTENMLLHMQDSLESLSIQFYETEQQLLNLKREKARAYFHTGNCLKALKSKLGLE